MSTTAKEGLRTPRRKQPDMTDESSAYFTFTPCTRLSRMAIDSSSVGLGRIRSSPQRQLPVTNFDQKLMNALREERESNVHHPNLDMCLSSQGISMYDNSKSITSFSEDEDSDDGDLFSSSLCPMSSPERPFTKESIFNDEIMLQVPPLSQVNYSTFDDEFIEQDNELNKNRPPPIWNNNETSSTQLSRECLREIEDTEDLPSRKKIGVSQHGKTHKIRLMRSLSPPRFKSKQKDTAI
ncbi:hypothetical protein BD560DRAFT_386009 [Blakeslea trispora]|nr:hypothetical protein BD560DRAFT_386009 [Blakeslea trispora]